MNKFSKMTAAALAVVVLGLVGCKSGEKSSNTSQSRHETVNSSRSSIGNVSNGSESDSASSSNESIAPNDFFNQKYGNLPTYKDVRNNPDLYGGKEFVLSGTAVICDYYNAYDYEGLYSICFCIRVTPTDGSSDWYVYALKGDSKEVYERLNGCILEVNMVCQSASTGLSHRQAGLKACFFV